MIGRVQDGAIHYAPVTSCIQIMLQLDGTHVVTVEGLTDADGLNPIQQAMVACHGAQCGFCTPGFVVSIQGLLDEKKPITSEQAVRGLVGNLCRCTGYDSIVRAATQVDPATVKSMNERYPPAQIVPTLVAAASQGVRIQTATKLLFKPVSLDAAIEFRAANPTCTIVCGATDLGVLYNKRTKPIDVALSIGGLPELRAVRRDGDSLYIGATASLSDLERITLEHLPELGRFLAWFGSPLIKNAGSLAGNLVTGSPIGDTPPALMVLGGQVDIAGPQGSRRVALGDFYTGYRQTVLRPDELVTGISIPLLKDGEIFRLYKVSRRKDLDISTFSAAIWMQCDSGRIGDVRIAFGGVAATVLRMTNVEAALRDGPASLDRFEQAAEIARDDVKPITDVRGSENYRRVLAGNVLLRFWHETFSDGGNNHDGNGHSDSGPRGRLRTVTETIGSG
jgi:xanthine dehydrogenase small subunit